MEQWHSVVVRDVGLYFQVELPYRALLFCPGRFRQQDSSPKVTWVVLHGGNIRIDENRLDEALARLGLSRDAEGILWLDGERIPASAAPRIAVFSYFCLLDIEGGDVDEISAEEVAESGRSLENLIRARYLGLPPKNMDEEVEWRLQHLFQASGIH